MFDFIMLRARIHDRRTNYARWVGPSRVEQAVIDVLAEGYREELNMQQIRLIAYDVHTRFNKGSA